MEEAPKNDAQEIARKLELLSGKTMEKYWPGLKERFDDLRDQRSSGELTEEAFWDRFNALMAGASIDEVTLNKVLEDR